MKVNDDASFEIERSDKGHEVGSPTGTNLTNTVGSGRVNQLSAEEYEQRARQRAEALDYALRYLELGWCLLPLAPGSKEPLERTKGAVYKWIFKHRMDPARSRGYYSVSGCGIGIITGACSDDLAVIDIEGEHVDAFLARYSLPNTPIATTPSGGIHIFVRDFSNRPTVNLYLDGVRIGELRRAAPSYVVAPPAEGRAWIVAPWNVRLAYLPSWTSELVKNPRAGTKSTAGRSTQSAVDRPSEESLPPVELRIRFAAERLSCGIVPFAVQGNDGHSALLRAAVDAVRGYCVPTGDGKNNYAFDVLWASFNPYCVPPWNEDEEHELLHKIDDAYHKGDKDWAYLLDYRMALEVASSSVECEASTDTDEENVHRSNNIQVQAFVGGANGPLPGRCLIDRSLRESSGITANTLTTAILGGSQIRSPLQSQPRQPPLPRVHSSPTARPSTEQLIAKMPSRRIPVPELLKFLHSDTRVIAEDGPRSGETLESRAFIVALGAVYANADVQSTTNLLLNCKGGIAVQSGIDPRIFAREIWLDAWRHRDREIENAIVMIVDKVFFDPDPDRSKTRALS